MSCFMLNIIIILFQSTRPARDATQISRRRDNRQGVSIHAPRAGRDPKIIQGGNHAESFNPRAPRGTRPDNSTDRLTENIVSIHAPRAGRDGRHTPSVTACKVSIHAPRAGRDRGRDRRGRRNAPVSIHAPRAGRDAERYWASLNPDVSIHAPRAGRDPPTWAAEAWACMFQSTRPARDATRYRRRARFSTRFQSTRPARDATRAKRRSRVIARGFNPRAPRGTRLPVTFNQLKVYMFQSTRPARDATCPPASPPRCQ